MNPDLFIMEHELRAGFPDWDPIQRGQALARCQRAGLSNRTLASMINKTEGSVRNFVLLLKLPPADQAAIKAGAPMRPCVIRLRQAEKRRKEVHAQQASDHHAQAARDGKDEILSWFRQQGIGSGTAEQILLEAHAVIRGAEREEQVKPSNVAWGGPPEPIVTAARPGNIDQLRGIDRINGYIVWLARMLVRLLPNSETRDSAIYAALGEPRKLGIS